MNKTLLAVVAQMFVLFSTSLTLAPHGHRETEKLPEMKMAPEDKGAEPPYSLRR